MTKTDTEVYVDTKTDTDVRGQITPLKVWELQEAIKEGEEDYGELGPRRERPKPVENHGPQAKKAPGPVHPKLAQSVQHSGIDPSETPVIAENPTAEEDLKDNLELILTNNPELQLHPALVNNPELRIKLANQPQPTPTTTPRLERR